MNAVLLMIALACHAEAPKADLHEVPAAAAAAALPEVALVKAAAGSVGEVKPATVGDTCSLVEMYSRWRLLSGPWSAKRRLETARIRGDTEEEERLQRCLTRWSTRRWRRNTNEV